MRPGRSAARRASGIRAVKVALALLLAASAAPIARAGSPSTLATLEAQVKAHDFSAARTAAALGPRAAAALEPFLRSPDAETRAVAVSCLDAAGGARARRALGLALADSAFDVRLAASQALYRSPGPEALPALLRAARVAREAAIRRNAILAAGLVHGAKARDLAAACAAEKDTDVVRACLAARGRQGDDPAQRAFLKLLAAAPQAARGNWVESCEYVDQAWMLPPLAAWLDDLAPARHVGADNLPGVKDLRVCDLVINLAARVARPKWHVAVAKAKNYSAPERREARDVIAGLAR